MYFSLDLKVANYRVVDTRGCRIDRQSFIIQDLTIFVHSPGSLEK